MAGDPMNERGQDAQRVVVFIDYQNVLNAARHAFCSRPYSAADGQIDPVRYGQLLISREPLGTSGTRELKEVRVYRGRPDPRKEPQTYSAHMRQCDAWDQSGATVVPRPLRYPRNWPDESAEEKGIDVQIAIDMVMRAVRRELDVAILASTDTDQRPVLEAFHALPFDDPPIIEVATWRSATYSQKLQVPGLHVWSHFFEEHEYRRIRDRRDYNIPEGQ
jgi:uncharacterized LabA/DUF88 family protein